MKGTFRLTSFVLPLLLLSTSRELHVSAQGMSSGTVQTALIDYMMKNNLTPSLQSPSSSSSSSFSSPSSSSTAMQQESPNPASMGTGSSGSSGSNLHDLYGQFVQSPPPQNSPTATNSNGGSSDPSFMSMLNKMIAEPPPQQIQQSSSPVGGSYPSLSPTNRLSSFEQVPGGSQSGSYSNGEGSGSMSSLNQLMSTMVQSRNQAGSPMSPPFPDPFPTTQVPITLQPVAKALPFVPPEWNLTNPQSHWGSGSQHAVSGWKQSNVLPAQTAWAHHGSLPRQPPPQRAPSPHPLSQMTMIPRVREMINKQARQFGELTYYQQHGCVDPTPTRPGPGGIRPTQTLWYGCQSPVSQMVCMRVGKTMAGKNNMMHMMIRMTNPTMTRVLEKCLAPRMMFGGGGMGGMNPMLMMAMSGGGEGEQNRASAAAANSYPPSPATQQIYPDHTRSNPLLTSQAARISPGAAQPQSLGGSYAANPPQTPASSLPSGAAQYGGNPSPMSAQYPGATPGGVDCSSLMPLMMRSAMAAGEGLNSPEAMEAIGELRKQFLPYSCQELRLKMTGMPLRLCCPGRVDPPTMFDLFKSQNAGGA
ncbi:hypothetical protein ACOMHN_029379 [Nucella lapillus]